MAKIMSFIVATNVVARRPPERRTPGTPHARANIAKVAQNVVLSVNVFLSARV